jgi:hypothetical protein
MKEGKALLIETQWLILNAMVDDVMEPLEEIVKDLRRQALTLSPIQFLEHLFALYQHGLVTVTQQPIPALGQDFEEKEIFPVSPQGLIGDLGDSFEVFYASGDYLSKESISPGLEPAGVPFGIYAALTEDGRKEWGKARYQRYHRD